MMNKDFANSLFPEVSLIPANYTSDQNGTGVDLAGYEGAVAYFVFGNSADTLSGTVYLTGVLQESDDNSTFTDVAAADLIGSLTVVDAPAEDSTVQKVGYRGNKRYLRTKFDFTGTHSSGIPCAGLVVRGNKRHN